jgi:hypothetical protein
MPSWKKVIISGSNASLSGLTVTGDATINLAKIRTYENSLVSAGTNVIGSFPTTDGNGVNFEYLVKSNLNYRVGNIMAVWDGSNINFTEVTTVDLGNTTDVMLSCRILSGNVEIIADVVGPTTWVIRTLAKIL